MSTSVIHSTGDALSQAYAPIQAELQTAERIFDQELVSQVDFVNELCTHVRSYRGKMLRPALLLLSAKAVGELNRAHPTLAAVVEMVHMATLVHDDVLDDAEHRRRRRTIKSLNGNSTAVLLGDYLISHSFHLCSSLDGVYASRRIGATTNEVCEGELLQNMHRGNFDLSEHEYFEIVRRKTGALTAVACELGAHYAGADETTVRAFHAYGLSAGVAFQIVDDVLDLVGDESEMGKTLRLDLALGKLTLPLIHCLAHADLETGLLVRETCAQTDPDLPRLQSALEQSGSIEYALAVADRHVAAAVAPLSNVPPGAARNSLLSLATFITQRRS